MSNRRLRKKNKNLEKELKQKDEKIEQQEKEIRELKKKNEQSINQSIVTKMIQAGYEKEEGKGSHLSHINSEYKKRKKRKEKKKEINSNLKKAFKRHTNKKNNNFEFGLKKTKPHHKNDDFLAYNNRYVQFLLNKKIEEIEAIQKNKNEGDKLILRMQKREEEDKRKSKLIYQQLYNVYEKINGKNYVGRINDIARIIGGDSQYQPWATGGARYKATKGNIIDSPNATQDGLLKKMANLIK